MQKILSHLLFVSALLVSAEAHAFVLCVTNRTSDVQDATFSDESGDRYEIRANPNTTSCADVGEAWRPFQLQLRDANNAQCSGKTVWPNHWVEVESGKKGITCTPRTDEPTGKPKLGDYSNRITFTNYATTPFSIQHRPQGSTCGYPEWTPLVLPPKGTTATPLRYVTSGSCFVIPTTIEMLVTGGLNTGHDTIVRITKIAGGGNRCYLQNPGRDRCKDVLDGYSDNIQVEVNP